MADGIGCTCHAYNENECGCGVDWTPQEIYDLRDQLAAVTAERDEKDRQVASLYQKWAECRKATLLEAAERIAHLRLGVVNSDWACGRDDAYNEVLRMTGKEMR